MKNKTIIFLIFTAIFSILTLGFDQLVYQIENKIIQKEDNINDIQLKFLENRSLIEFLSRKTIVLDWNTLNLNDKLTKSYFIENDLSMRFNSHTHTINSFITDELTELANKIDPKQQKDNYQEIYNKIADGKYFNDFTIEENTFEWSVTNSLNQLVNLKKLYLTNLIQGFEDEYLYFLKKDMLIRDGNYETFRQIFVLGSFIATMLSIIFLLLYFRSLLKVTKVK
jgi:hypothetical protein